MPTANDYNIVLYRQSDGWWVAQIPVIESCHALMPTRDEALDELQLVFEMIQEEFDARGEALPVNRELIPSQHLQKALTLFPHPPSRSSELPWLCQATTPEGRRIWGSAIWKKALRACLASILLPSGVVAWQSQGSSELREGG